MYRSRFFLGFLLVLQVAAKEPHISKYNSLSLLKPLEADKPPLIVVVDARDYDKPAGSDFDDMFITGGDGLREGDGDVTDDETKDKARNFLFKFLRSSPDDNEEAQVSKQALRQAVKIKCTVVINCVKECPPRRPQCPIDCQKVFDALDICGRPKKTKWGSTMPPSWLLL